MRLNIVEAKNRLSELVRAAQAGKDVVIAKNGRPMVRLVPIAPAVGLKGFGSLRAAGRGAGSSLWRYLRAALTTGVRLRIERDRSPGRAVKL